MLTWTELVLNDVESFISQTFCCQSYGSRLDVRIANSRVLKGVQNSDTYYASSLGQDL